jgi:hypothetical protein
MDQHLNHMIGQFFQSLAFLDLIVIDFTWAAMLVTRASNHANLAFMVLGWP